MVDLIRGGEGTMNVMKWAGENLAAVVTIGTLTVAAAIAWSSMGWTVKGLLDWKKHFTGKYQTSAPTMESP